MTSIIPAAIPFAHEMTSIIPAATHFAHGMMFDWNEGEAETGGMAPDRAEEQP